MSDTTITQGFIEMVEAYKAKPELEAKIATLEADNGICYQTIELKANQLAEAETRIAELNSRLSEVTKERDDAMFRSLELDEKLSGIEKLLGLAERLEQARRDEHQATVDALTPKLELLTEPTPYVPFWDQTVPINPVVVESQPNFDGPAIPDQGQSEDRPTDTGLIPSTTAGQPENDTMISKDGPETQTQSEPKINPYSGLPIRYPEGEYKGQFYDDKPYWVSWAAFVDAGGEPEPFMQPPLI